MATDKEGRGELVDWGAPAKAGSAGAYEQSFVTLRTEIDRLIGDFLRGFGPPVHWRTSGYNPFGRVDVEFGGSGIAAPRADLVETADRFVLTIELPGLERDDVEVSLVGDDVVVSGNKDEGEIDDNARIHFRERRFGTFRRSFRMPGAVDRDNLAATFDHGVLTVDMPKRVEVSAAAKKVDVRAG